MSELSKILPRNDASIFTAMKTNDLKFIDGILHQKTIYTNSIGGYEEWKPVPYEAAQKGGGDET
jgi:hypothetical protein